MQTKFNDFNFWHLTAQFGTKNKNGFSFNEFGIINN